MRTGGRSKDGSGFRFVVTPFVYSAYVLEPAACLIKWQLRHRGLQYCVIEVINLVLM